MVDDSVINTWNARSAQKIVTWFADSNWVKLKLALIDIAGLRGFSDFVKSNFPAMP